MVPTTQPEKDRPTDGRKKGTWNKIKIDPEFHSLIPPLTVEERNQLETNLKRDGCREPLVVWQEKHILLDGHNRHEICTVHEIPYAVTAYRFASRNDAKWWVITNQFGRRNLTPYQRAELALLAEPLLRQQAKDRQRLGGREKVPQTSAEPVAEKETRNQIARLANVSHDTIAKAKVIHEKAPEDVKAKLRTGETTINAEHKRIVQADKKAERNTRRAKEMNSRGEASSTRRMWATRTSSGAGCRPWRSWTSLTFRRSSSPLRHENLDFGDYTNLIAASAYTDHTTASATMRVALNRGEALTQAEVQLVSSEDLRAVFDDLMKPMLEEQFRQRGRPQDVEWIGAEIERLDDFWASTIEYRRVHSNGQAMLVQILQVPLGDREVRLTLACREDEKTLFLPVLQAIRESLRVDSHSDLDNTHQETPRSTVDGRRLFERMTERAIERNPEVNLTEALTREAKAMEERMVNDLGTSDEVKEVEAASAFWGYFLRSTRATIQYCETLGVAAVDFAAEFTA